ncbi:hypothetical protein VT03_00740 [Planctomyces sp. SH-PL14]|nr:hypothetical protein VT03_00740 [Planctomyces sp. SH-PL14]
MTATPLIRSLLVLAPFVAAGHFAAYYSLLPARVASHFGASGAADGWMSRGAFGVTYVGTVLLMAALFGGISALVRRLPIGLINLPHREYWLAEPRREETLRRLNVEMGWLGLGTILLLIVTFQLCLEANRNGTFRLGNAIWGALAVYLVAMTVWLIRFVLRYSHVPSQRDGGHASLAGR